MRRRRLRNAQRQSIDEINVTPLLDLTFLLLIAFMITMPLMEYGTKVSPPEMNSAELPQEKFKSVSLTGKGTILVGDEVVFEEQLIEKLKALKTSHYNAWMTYNKPFGWEVFDIRYGGLVMRFESCRERLCAYISGEISSIPELEAERLRIDCSDTPANIRAEHIVWRRYLGYSTTSILS